MRRTCVHLCVSAGVCAPSLVDTDSWRKTRTGPQNEHERAGRTLANIGKNKNTGAKQTRNGYGHAVGDMGKEMEDTNTVWTWRKHGYVSTA